jgi:uncharacterized protein YndB with AHSA1/START domain
MDKPSFVYVTYIAATAEAVWNAIVDPKIAAPYWGNVNLSDWKIGSKWEHRDGDANGKLRLVGNVVEVEPYTRLVMTWAFPEDANDIRKHSRVTFDIKPLDNVVRLTVTHVDLEAGSRMHDGISEGWPKVLSSMKSYLEHGEALFSAMSLGR